MRLQSAPAEKRKGAPDRRPFLLESSVRRAATEGDRDGDAEARGAAGRSRRPANYFLFAAVFFFAGFLAAFFATGFLAAFFAGLRVAVLANVILLSVLSPESAHIYSSATCQLTTR